MQTDFPVDEVIEALLSTLDEQGVAILEAPPGAGKSTRVPLALLKHGWGERGRIIMLEPRRVAARSVASFMAAQLGEPVGQTVGYRTRTDTRMSAATRLEVVTEGVLTRMALADPELYGISLVIFDEFHERSLNGDLGLALITEIRHVLREDLALLVMSATLDCGPLVNFLKAPLVRSEGRSYPVSITHKPPVPRQDWREHCALVVSELAAQGKVTLVFLPGRGDIRWLARALASQPVAVESLHGGLSLDHQQTVLERAAEGEPLIVLTTNVAETSLTIPGVSQVIDSGLAREPVYDSARHRSRLVTRRISEACAAQRAGRAGRLGPGRCIRLWPESEVMASHQKPEIQRVGLDQLVLDLARWGCSSPGQMQWLDSPPEAAWNSAVARLRQGGAVDAKGALTATGKALAKVGIEPALAMLVIGGQQQGLAVTASRVAALLAERDILPDQGADLRPRLQALENQPKRFATILAEARRLQQDKEDEADWQDALGALLASVFPMQIARQRSSRQGYYQMADGPGLQLGPSDPLMGTDWLLVLDTDGQPRDARIRLAMPLRAEQVESAVTQHGGVNERLGWDAQRQRVSGWQERCLGQLILYRQPMANLSPEQLSVGLLDGVRQQGLSLLPWTDSNRQWLARARKLAELETDWPALSETALLDSLEGWLQPFLAGMRTLADLQQLPLQHALDTLLDSQQHQQLQRQLPASLTIPSGRTVALDYEQDNVVLAVKLQELYGLEQLPELAGGRLRISVHLLTPAGRPAAITDNLARFWRENYSEVRKELRGRYPKHPWPEDPLTAQATALTKNRLQKT